MSTSADLIESREQLIRYFESGAKSREQWRVGTEYEKVTVSAHDGRALPYSGPRGVEQLLRRMAERYGYEPDEEDGRIIGLNGERAAITIEPGSQIELSGEQCETIHCAHAEFSRHIEQLIEVGHELGATVLGPAPCPVERARDRWRWHLLVKTPDDAALTRLAGYLASRAPVPAGARMVVDRDPASVL